MLLRGKRCVLVRGYLGYVTKYVTISRWLSPVLTCQPVAGSRKRALNRRQGEKAYHYQRDLTITAGSGPARQKDRARRVYISFISKGVDFGGRDRGTGQLEPSIKHGPTNRAAGFRACRFF
jgi:hypothetical protein